MSEFENLLDGKLKEIFLNVEKTHPRLGKLAVLETICDVAGKCLLVIGTAGTGKSAVLKYISKNVSREKIFLDAITINGLKHLQKKLHGNTMTILIDDISKGGTEYSQIQTIVAMGELCYSGFLKKYTQTISIEIENFDGSCIINGQPLILKKLLRAAEFETDIRDKVIRYYHLPRPVKPNPKPPRNNVKYDYNTSEVIFDPELPRTSEYQAALENFRRQFTLGRAIEHLNDMIIATAAIQERRHVSIDDVKIVEYLSRNFIIEGEIFYKRDLEGSRKLDVNIIPLLSIIASYGKRNIEDIETEFQVKRARVYEIVQKNAHIAQFKDRTLIPTHATIKLLKTIGEWHPCEEKE